MTSYDFFESNGMRLPTNFTQNFCGKATLKIVFFSVSSSFQYVYLLNLFVGAPVGIFKSETDLGVERQFPFHFLQHALPPLIYHGALGKTDGKFFLLFFWTTGTNGC